MESNYINIKEIAEAKGLKSTRSLRLQINKPNSPYIAREVEVNGGTSYEILYSTLEPEIQELLRTGETKSTAGRLGFLPQQIKIIILYATFSQTASQFIYVLQNFLVEGETLHYEYKLPFNFFALGLNCNKKLLKPSENRTFCIELHNAINSTNSNLFRQILSLKKCIYPNA